MSTNHTQHAIDLMEGHSIYDHGNIVEVEEAIERVRQANREFLDALEGLALLLEKGDF